MGERTVNPIGFGGLVSDKPIFERVLVNPGGKRAGSNALALSNKHGHETNLLLDSMPPSQKQKGPAR